MTGGSFTLTSSKGLCAVDGTSKLLTCSANNSAGSEFLIVRRFFFLIISRFLRFMQTLSHAGLARCCQCLLCLSSPFLVTGVHACVHLLTTQLFSFLPFFVPSHAIPSYLMRVQRIALYHTIRSCRALTALSTSAVPPSFQPLMSPPRGRKSTCTARPIKPFP